MRPSRLSASCVSYTWDNDEATKVIYLDGQDFFIRPNKWLCLNYLGKAAQSISWNWLWVDAICINQDDNYERNAQVRRMDDVYKNSVCVSVWLGLPALPPESSFPWPDQIPARTLDTGGFNWMTSMTELANRLYWSRFWVIQEYLLGNNVELYCGDNHVDWKVFQKLLCKEAKVDPFDNDVGVKSSPTAAYAALQIVLGRHNSIYDLYFPHLLLDLLIMHRQSKCKDSRDRVFALLGLIPHDERQFLDRWFPDYNIPAKDVLAITTAHLLFYCPEGTLRNGVKITAQSDELFQGLGVELIAERRKILHRAKYIPYPDIGTPSKQTPYFAFNDEIIGFQPLSNDQYENSSNYWSGNHCDEGARKTSSRVTWTSWALGLSALALALWWERSSGFKT